MSGCTIREGRFAPEYLLDLRKQIRASRYFTVNNLNRDFVGTRGFSVVFHRGATDRVRSQFPWTAPFLAEAQRDDCNAFYLNPLQLSQGVGVGSHIDRSLHAYIPEVDPPRCVTVLYVEVPKGMIGGVLELRRGKKFLRRVQPQEGLLVEFDGDLDHGVQRVDSPGLRLSLVMEQYELGDEELEGVPEFAIETRAKAY